MTFLVFVSTFVLGLTTARAVDLAQCEHNLIDVIRALGPQDVSLVTELLHDLRRFKNARVLFGFPSNGGSFDRMTLAAFEVENPNLKFPKELQVLEEGHRWFVAEGSAKVLRTFAMDLRGAFSDSLVESHILDGNVAALGRVHTANRGKPISIDARTVDLHRYFDDEIDENEGWFLSDRESGRSFTVFRKETLAPFLNFASVTSHTGLIVTETSAHDELEEILERFGSQLARPVAAVVRHREFYLVNERGVGTLKALAAQLDEKFRRDDSAVPKFMVLQEDDLVPQPAAALIRPRATVQALPLRELIEPEFGRELAAIADRVKHLQLDPAQFAREMATDVGRARARIAAAYEPLQGTLGQLMRNAADYATEGDVEVRQLMVEEHERLEARLETQYAQFKAQISEEWDDGTKEVFLEITSGENGHGDDLVRLQEMYLNLADQRGWTAEVLETQFGKLGHRLVRLRLAGRGVGALTLTERGPHRVQLREIKTGKVYTRYQNVSVFPRSEVKLDFDEKDLEVAWERSNLVGSSTLSAVRVHHVPTGLAVKIDGVRGRASNLYLAKDLLRSQLAEQARFEHEARQQEVRLAKSDLAPEEGRFTRAYDLKTPDAVTENILSGKGLDEILCHAKGELLRRRVHELASVTPDTP